VLQPRRAIVNISDVIAEMNLPGMAAYDAWKAAVRSFDQAPAREARRRRVLEWPTPSAAGQRRTFLPDGLKSIGADRGESAHWIAKDRLTS